MFLCALRVVASFLINFTAQLMFFRSEEKNQDLVSLSQLLNPVPDLLHVRHHYWPNSRLAHFWDFSSHNAKKKRK